jgi:hypothetical protein
LPRAGDKTSKQEALLAKPLKPRKKLVVKGAEGHSSGLTIGARTSLAKTSFGPPLVMKANVEKMLTTPVAGADCGYMSMCVVNMLDSSVSYGGASPLKCRQKRVRKSPSPRARLNRSEVTGAPVTKGLTLSSICLAFVDT